MVPLSGKGLSVRETLLARGKLDNMSMRGGGVVQIIVPHCRCFCFLKQHTYWTMDTEDARRSVQIDQVSA